MTKVWQYMYNMYSGIILYLFILLKLNILDFMLEIQNRLCAQFTAHISLLGQEKIPHECAGVLMLMDPCLPVLL